MRMFLARLILGSMFGVSAMTATAQGYPSRPVRLLVGLAAGGPTDVVARIVGNYLGERLGQPLIIENKPGASGIIAAKAVVTSPPDGYNLLWASSSITVLPLTSAGAHFFPETELKPVAALVVAPQILLVNANSPYKTFGDLATALKETPNKLNFGSPGVGTASYLQGVIMMQQGKLLATHVPYKGAGPVTQDLLAGLLDFTIDSSLTAMPFVRSQRLRPLAVTTINRSSLLPNVPALSEVGFAGFDMAVWFGIFAPASTPTAIVEKIAAEAKAVSTNKQLQQELAERGAEVFYRDPKQFGALVRQDLSNTKTKVRELDIKLE